MPSIRGAKVSDLAAIMEIEHAAFAQANVENPQLFQARIETFGAGFLVLEQANFVQPVGYVCSEIHKYLPLPPREHFELGHDVKLSHVPAGTELYISSMGLLPELRGQGLGACLIEELLHRAAFQFPTLQTALLMVGVSWIPAQKTYKRLQFKELSYFSEMVSTADNQKEAVILMRRAIH